MNETALTHPLLTNEEGEDTHDDDWQNMVFRAGFLGGLSLTFERGSNERKMLQRAARSLAAAADRVRVVRELAGGGK